MSYKIEVQPNAVDKVIKKHLLRDGYDMVMDLEKSQGVYVYDSKNDRKLLDFFTCFATIPVGYNHPKMADDEEFKKSLLAAALINPSNSDIYTTQFAQFLETFSKIGIPDYLNHAFFISGGALAVENALKVAMDWKVQKNYQKGYTHEVGHQILHFKESFHGRSGYTMSLTNTDPAKTNNFAQFNWPRISNPKIKYPESPENNKDLIEREKLTIRQIQQAFLERKDEIAAIIIEPIQCEGGDHHFRKEFFENLRIIADENEALLIYDEVQVGVGITGKFWCHQHFGDNTRPDIITFGKKMQTCGILVGNRVDEVPNNCFNVSSRINSTWGGNLADFVRSTRILQIIEEDKLIENAHKTGTYFLNQLTDLHKKHPKLTNIRGRGLIVSFDFPTPDLRNEFIKQGFSHGAMFLGCSTHSIRFRPALTITPAEIDKGIEIINNLLKTIGL